MITLIRIQSIFRGMRQRKKVKSNYRLLRNSGDDQDYAIKNENIQSDKIVNFLNNIKD
jgi:hypothetical protein